MTNTCPNCGAPLKGTVCEYCDSEFPERAKPVKQEQGPIKTEPQVVYVYENKEPKVSKKKRSIALALCLFFGLLGAHRFYLGKYFSGFIILCLFFAYCGNTYEYSNSFFIVLLVVIIDAIRIIKGKMKDSKGLPLMY